MARKDEKIRRLEDRTWDIQRESDEKIISLPPEYEDRLYEQERVTKELENQR